MTSNTHLGAPKARIGIAAAFVLAITSGCMADSPDAATTTTSDQNALSGEIVWADFGGPTTEAREEIYFDTYHETHGVEVVTTSVEGSIRSSMLRGDPGDYDVFQASSDEMLSETTSNLLELPEDARSDLLPEALRPFYIGAFAFGNAQGWLTETFPEGGPENWEEFFDLERFPGARAWPGDPAFVDSSYEIALLADGVPPDELYPLDIERAEAKLDTIREELIFYQSYPEVQQLLTSGSVAIAVTVTGQFTALADAGKDVTVQWNEAFSVPSGFVAPAGTDKKEEIVELARWLNGPEQQAQFTTRTGYAPTNSAVFDHLSNEVAEEVVNSPSHTNILEWDIQWRADHYTELVDAYTRWLTK